MKLYGKKVADFFFKFINMFDASTDLNKSDQSSSSVGTGQFESHSIS